MQRRNSAEAVDLTKSIECHHSEAPAISTPPREEPVARPNRQPAKAAPSAPSKTKAKSPPTSEAKERYIRRRPKRTIESRAPYRSGPPRPRSAIPHPPPVVIRRPAPGLISNPRPAVVRLPNPISIAIRSPTTGLIRHPYLSVVRSIFPASVGVQILRPNVVFVGVVPRRRLVDHAVAISIPPVPIVPLRSRADLVSRIGSRPAHRRHLPLLHFTNTLRSRNLRLAFAHDDHRISIGPNFDAEDSI